MGTENVSDDGFSLLGREVSARAIRPRVVLGLLLIGSLFGIWTTHLGSSVWMRVVSWLVVVAVGLLTGGLYWRLVLLERSGFRKADNRRYVRDRWERLETISLWLFVIPGVTYISFDSIPVSLGSGSIVLGVALVSAPFLWIGGRWFADTVAARRLFRFALFGSMLVSLGGVAWIETGTNPLDWVVRIGHLGAFSLWLGGAVWHNFVVRPTVRSRPDAADALKAQARRFRRHLPAVIGLVFVTGLYQTERLVGLSLPVFLDSTVGHLIGGKLFVLIVLTGMVVAAHRKDG